MHLDLTDHWQMMRNGEEMKIGDIVYSTKIRPYEHAVIIKADVDIRWREGKDGVRKKRNQNFICCSIYRQNNNDVLWF